MPLTGQAKIDYQREYMRKRRSNIKTEQLDPVRPEPVRPVRPDREPLTKERQVSQKGFNG